MRANVLLLGALLSIAGGTTPAAAQSLPRAPIYTWEKDCVWEGSPCLTGFWPASAERLLLIVTSGGRVGTEGYTRVFAVDAAVPRVLYVINLRDSSFEDFLGVARDNWVEARPGERAVSGVLGGKGPAPPDPGPGGGGDLKVQTRVASYARVVSDAYDLLAQ